MGLLIGLSQSYIVLVILLIIAALLGGGYHPAAAVTISTTVPPEQRGQSLGFHLLGGSSAFWVIPLLATPIAVAWGWRGAYITLAIPAFVLGILLYIFIGKKTQTQTAEQKTKDREVPTTSARIPWGRILPFFIISVSTGTMIHSVLDYVSLFAVDQLGVAMATAAMLVAITPAVGLFGAPFGGYLSDRIGGVPVMLVTSFVSIPLIYLVGIVPNITALIVLLVVIGVLTYARGPTSESYIIENTPEHRRSTILGAYFLATAEASGLLTSLVGVLIDRFGFSSSFAIVSAALATIVVVCTIFMWRAQQQR
jgi:NNP family nitrate/nitrite transporter-like MFS transporter